MWQLNAVNIGLLLPKWAKYMKSVNEICTLAKLSASLFARVWQIFSLVGKFRWQGPVWQIQIFSYKIVLNLFDRGKRRSNEKFIEAVAVKVGRRKRPAEVLANTSLGTPDNFFSLEVFERVRWYFRYFRKRGCIFNNPKYTKWPKNHFRVAKTYFQCWKIWSAPKIGPANLCVISGTRANDA